MDIRQIETYFMIFIFYSVLGWMMESFGGLLKTKKFVNRGFLIGPYCPVYGWGVLFITIFLQKYVDDLPVLFIMSIVLCGTLEYFTSFFMEKIFHARWWDYKNRKFNINGRICLETLLPFGILGTTILKFVNPLYLNLIEKISNIALHWIVGILLTLIFIDTIVSFFIISNLKKVSDSVTKDKSETKDNTEEISKKVKEEVEIIGEKVSKNAEEFAHKVSTGAEGAAMEFSSKVYHLSRKVNIGKKRFTNKVKRGGRKISDNLKSTPKEIADKIKTNNKLYMKVQDNGKRYKKMQEELQSKIKNNFSKKSLLHRRITQAFPNLKIDIKLPKIKENTNKNVKEKEVK
jgi:uncharacterized membrane protein